MLGYLEQQGYDHQLICTEAGDLDLALFTKHVLNPLNPIPIIEQLLAIPDIQALVQQVGADGRVTDDERKQVAYALKSNPDSRPVLERYQAEGLTKRVAITLGSGVSQFYWGSIQDYPVEESPDWYHIIMSLTDVDGRRKPHFYTYQLLIEKMAGFEGAEIVAREPMLVRFDTVRGAVWVAWSESGEQTADLGAHLGSGDVQLTPIVVELDAQDQPIRLPVQTVPATAVPLSTTPVILE